MYHYWITWDWETHRFRRYFLCCKAFGLLIAELVTRPFNSSLSNPILIIGNTVSQRTWPQRSYIHVQADVCDHDRLYKRMSLKSFIHRTWWFFLWLSVKVSITSSILRPLWYQFLQEMSFKTIFLKGICLSTTWFVPTMRFFSHQWRTWQMPWHGWPQMFTMWMINNFWKTWKLSERKYDHFLCGGGDES